MAENPAGDVTRQTDPERANPVQELATGYPKISNFMELIPEAAIFRRFGALNARRLLYLQAELLQLQSRLEAVELSDKQSNDQRREMYSVDWEWLEASMNADDPATKKQWLLIQEIGTKLKEYSKRDWSNIS